MPETAPKVPNIALVLMSNILDTIIINPNIYKTIMMT